MPDETPRYQRAVELRRQGRSRAEIAVEMGTTEYNVSKLLHYARARGFDSLTDHQMKPEQTVNYLRHMRHKGAIPGLGTIQAAVRDLDRADIAAIMRLSQTGETFATTLVRVTLETAKTSVKGHGQGPRQR